MTFTFSLMNYLKSVTPCMKMSLWLSAIPFSTSVYTMGKKCEKCPKVTIQTVLIPKKKVIFFTFLMPCVVWYCTKLAQRTERDSEPIKETAAKVLCCHVNCQFNPRARFSTRHLKMRQVSLSQQSGENLCQKETKGGHVWKQDTYTFHSTSKQVKTLFPNGMEFQIQSSQKKRCVSRQNGALRRVLLRPGKKMTITFPVLLPTKHKKSSTLSREKEIMDTIQYLKDQLLSTAGISWRVSFCPYEGPFHSCTKDRTKKLCWNV